MSCFTTSARTAGLLLCLSVWPLLALAQDAGVPGPLLFPWVRVAEPV